MSKTKHTPGPWGVGLYPEDPNQYIVTKNQTIATCDQGYYDNPIDAETCKANAHLIAAAPELLKLIEQINDWYGENGGPLSWDSIGLTEDDVSVRYLLKRAIAKARGE